MILRVFILFLCCFVMETCTVKYSFTGASISPEVKTVSVSEFPNNAPLVHPRLAVVFSEKLKDRFLNQTSLLLVSSAGDLNFEGEIVDYNTSPVAIQSGDQAAFNRLTIVVNVRFSNAYNPKQNFESRFSRYADYDSRKNLEDVQESLIESIVEELTEDIFNKSVANW